jgi:PAS domain S-box-containing protein
VQSAPDAILIVDGSGIIEHTNDALNDLLGYSIGELAGQHLKVLLPERFRAAHEAHRAHYMSNPERRNMGEHVPTVAKRKDGEEVPIAAALSAFASEGTLKAICIIRHITDAAS